MNRTVRFKRSAKSTLLMPPVEFDEKRTVEEFKAKLQKQLETQEVFIEWPCYEVFSDKQPDFPLLDSAPLGNEQNFTARPKYSEAHKVRDELSKLLKSAGEQCEAKRTDEARYTLSHVRAWCNFVMADYFQPGALYSSAFQSLYYYFGEFKEMLCGLVAFTLVLCLKFQQPHSVGICTLLLFLVLSKLFQRKLLPRLFDGFLTYALVLKVSSTVGLVERERNSDRMQALGCKLKDLADEVHSNKRQTNY